MMNNVNVTSADNNNGQGELDPGSQGGSRRARGRRRTKRTQGQRSAERFNAGPPQPAHKLADASDTNHPRRKGPKSGTNSGKNKKFNSPLLAPEAIEVAREALSEWGEDQVGEHIGVLGLSTDCATHRFAAAVPGYSGWEWHVVLAAAYGTDYVTVSEVALVPAQEALQPPEWVPWAERVQPGDLGPGDVMPAQPNDPRLADGKLSAFGLDEALQRWRKGDFGPTAEMAVKAQLRCDSCAFFLPWERSFGVCANEYSADGRVVHSAYGCGAHSKTSIRSEDSTPPAPFDDDKPIF
ncbi:MAG: DUF3027 domain-containing protein [Corynebacterium sp.]|nr:DUF3027 domain-containing protein [Corynebacterium sp.]